MNRVPAATSPTSQGRQKRPPDYSALAIQLAWTLSGLNIFAIDGFNSLGNHRLLGRGSAWIVPVPVATNDLGLDRCN